MLVFSDSRQRAAFFAPYLQQTTAESAYLEPLVKAIQKAENYEDRPVTFDEISRDYVKGLQNIPIIVIKEREEDGVEYFKLIPRNRLLAPHKTAARKEAVRLLFQHYCKSTKHKNTLQGCCIAALTTEFTDFERETILKELPILFNKGEDKGWDVIQALVDVFLQRTAIEFPPYITTRDVFEYGPKVATYNFSQSASEPDRQIIRWNPYKSPQRSRKNAVNRNRQLTILTKSLDLDRETDAEQLDAILTKLWDFFKNGLLLQSSQWPGEFRLDPDRLQLTSKKDWYSCDRCSRITTLGKLGICLSSMCSGKPKLITSEEFKRRFKFHHYRKRFYTSSLPLEVREHTAQLTTKYGNQYQEDFMKGNINVLSSSTTFEMGVDVGQLKAVLLRNVPPTASSYIQRAGRAGRRKDGVSIVITYTRNLPHDQYHYQNPEDIIIGKVPSLYINITNKPLTQRHCNSLILGNFLRDISDIEESILDRTTVCDFFITDFNGKTFVIKLTEWCHDSKNKLSLLAAINAILPKDSTLSDNSILDEAIFTLISSAESVFEYHVKKPLERFQDQMKQVKSQLDSASGRQRIALATALNSLERLEKQFLDQRLIDFLSSCSWLPGYAFPQDIVKLLVRQVDYTDRMRLERDREIGISEYAPGAEIIADGRLIKSGGIWFNSQEPDIRKYARCPDCRSITTYLETETPSLNCTSCETRLTGKYIPRSFIKPDGFTTLLSDEIKLPSLSRTRPPRTSEVFLLEGADTFEKHTSLGISFGMKKGGKLFRANSGYNFDGFLICRKCGRGFSHRPNGNAHETPWGTQCRGTIKKVDLAHEIVTDILQIRFDNCSPPPPPITDKSFWLSLLTAFLNGVFKGLGISTSDLDGTYHGLTEESWIGELVIYDRIPGGAGHIPRIVKNLDKVLHETLDRVIKCNCPDIDASCYACLRNYSNQFDWDILSRRRVIEWLSEILK